MACSISVFVYVHIPHALNLLSLQNVSSWVHDTWMHNTSVLMRSAAHCIAIGFGGDTCMNIQGILCNHELLLDAKVIDSCTYHMFWAKASGYSLQNRMFESSCQATQKYCDVLGDNFWNKLGANQSPRHCTRMQSEKSGNCPLETCSTFWNQIEERKRIHLLIKPPQNPTISGSWLFWEDFWKEI